jgi:amino acid transporter
MRAVLAAATGLPTILLTAALVVVVCFWLLAAVGVADVNSFDTDVDVQAWRRSGVPVTVAFSLLAVLAWSLSVGAAVVLGVLAPATPADGLLRLIAPVGALLAAWVMTCRIVGLWRRLFPDEPVLSGLGDVRTGDDAASREAREAA